MRVIVRRADEEPRDTDSSDLGLRQPDHFGRVLPTRLDLVLAGALGHSRRRLGREGRGNGERRRGALFEPLEALLEPAELLLESFDLRRPGRLGERRAAPNSLNEDRSEEHTSELQSLTN